MSQRKLVRIADTPGLPTIKDYFGMMAAGQAEEIRRLKLQSAGKSPKKSAKPPTDKAVPYPWLLHPTRRTKTRGGKAAGNDGTRPAAEKAPKRSGKKAPSKRRG
jgi:hypothetical protein